MRSGPLVVSVEKRQTERICLLATIWLLLFSLIFMRTPGAAAHSSLVKSEPRNGEVLDESPAQVTTWFSEELDAEFSTMRIFDSQNNQVDNGDGGVDLNDLDHLSMIVSLSPLPSGIYTVRWAVLSADDGDPTQGEFTFSVSGGEDSSESSTPSGNGFPMWLVSGASVLLVFVVLIWALFLRKSPSG